MATSPTFPISASVLFDAARALDRSPKPTPPAATQPTLNTIAAAKPSSAREADRRAHERRYALAALEYECQKLAAAPPSTRHERRLKSARALGGFVPCGALTAIEIEAALFSARIPESNVKGERQTIRDGIRYGEAAPRVIPDRPYAAPSSGVDPELLEDVDLVAELRDRPRTDAGNAECLAILYGAVFRYDRSRKKWLRWGEVRWLVDADDAMFRAATATARARQAAMLAIENVDDRKKAVGFAIGSENASRVNAMLSTAQHLEEFSTVIDQYDRQAWLATVPNGTLELSRQQLRDSAPGDYLTKQLGASYDPGAAAPRWTQFLGEVFAGDADVISYVQRAVGYCLTGDTREQKLFLCYGGGANGKSVFLDVLMHLLGDYAANASFDTFDAGRRNEATNDLAALKGARLVTVIESDEDRRLSEARIKAVTGQDVIKCRFLYGEYFEYRPTFKLWFAMNHKPIIKGTDAGIWRRVQLIPFTQSFLGREDKTLKRTLLAELPGILNWALAGLRQWQQRGGIGTAAAIDTATDEYRKESDLVAQWLDECCVDDREAQSTAATLFDSYRTWCKSYGYREPTATSLGRSLVEKGYHKAHTKRGNAYEGLRLAEIVDAAPVFAVGDKAHDDRMALNARAQLRVGNYAKAREHARQIRGVTQQAELERAIDEAEGASA